MFTWCFKLLALLAICHCTVAKLPSSITPCARDDPQLERCIIAAVYQVRPLLAHGNLGDGYTTPPLEPLALDNIEVGRSSQFQAVFTDIEASGGSNFVIDRLIAKPDEISYDLWLTLPRIDFKGKYFMRLNLLLLDIKGKGNMRGFCENAKASVKMRGARYLKNGKEYIKFTKMSMRIQFKDFKLHLDNLFNGDRILGDVGNTLINENQKLYMNEIVPGLERGLSQKFLEVANEILATATFDEMFPPSRTVVNSPVGVPGPSIFEPSFQSKNPAGGILDQLPLLTPPRRPASQIPAGGILDIDPRLGS
ncbi:protein takeout [Scaptodrosophila lebanonensis]|uniref:Protein takeout n=1 Tax=Drosophila lebanonensis TaxID=7225 RepID=A0A6J2UH75_DROLE|nr:protein takeout [Scaptodrosophila lebanonensis]